MIFEKIVIGIANEFGIGKNFLSFLISTASKNEIDFYFGKAKMYLLSSFLTLTNGCKIKIKSFKFENTLFKLYFCHFQNMAKINFHSIKVKQVTLLDKDSFLINLFSSTEITYQNLYLIIDQNFIHSENSVISLQNSNVNKKPTKNFSGSIIP